MCRVVWLQATMIQIGLLYVCTAKKFLTSLFLLITGTEKFPFMQIKRDFTAYHISYETLICVLCGWRDSK